MECWDGLTSSAIGVLGVDPTDAVDISRLWLGSRVPIEFISAVKRNHIMVNHHHWRHLKHFHNR